MGIEAGGNKDHLRFELIQRRKPRLLHSLAELLAAAVGGKRNIDHLLRTSLDAAVRIKRVLKRRNHQHTAIAPEDIFGSIAMMYVEIHDRDALEPMDFKSMGDTHGDIVEKAESHRMPAAGVMSRRPNVAKVIFGFAPDYHLGCPDNRAGRMQRSRQRLPN